jgi:hypothetical protein
MEHLRRKTSRKEHGVQEGSYKVFRKIMYTEAGIDDSLAAIAIIRIFHSFQLCTCEVV